MKDYLKVIITALVTALTTIIVTGFVNRETKIKNAATQDELILMEGRTTEQIKAVEKKTFNYTDLKLKEHEERELRRDEMLIKYLDQRFDDLEKLVNVKTSRL